MGTQLTGLLASFALVAGPLTPQEPGKPPRCLTLEYVESVETVIDKDGAGPEPSTTEHVQTTLVASLGPRCLAVQSRDTLRVWDFEAGVVRTIDRSARTHDEVSVLHEVAFVQIEMQNRLALRGVMQSADIKLGDEWSPFDLAVLFGWPAKGDDVTLERTEADGEVRFAKDGTVVTSWRLGDHALDEAQRAMFVRLLQRQAHLHPQAMAALAGAGQLPRELTFRWRHPGAQTTARWRLVGARDAEWPGSIEGLTRTFGEGPLARIARMVCAPDAEGVPQRLSAERFAELAEAAAKDGRHAEAAMLLLESSLTTGEQVPLLRRLAAEPGAKEQMSPFMRPIGLTDRDPDQALALFAALDRSALSRPAFVDVFRVNALRQKGKVDEARDLMLATLAASPWITMAYKDLGDLCFAGYATDQAWTAWELGRRIAPRHGCWKEVEAYEARLRREFADRL